MKGPSLGTDNEEYNILGSRLGRALWKLHLKDSGILGAAGASF